MVDEVAFQNREMEEEVRKEVEREAGLLKAWGKLDKYAPSAKETTDS